MSSNRCIAPLFFIALFAVGGCGGGDAPKAAPGAGAGGNAEAEEQLASLAEVVGVSTAIDLNADPHVLEINLSAGYAEVELTPGKRTKVMAYNGMVPGPLLQARVGDRIIVHFENKLDEPTTVHWHGLRISDTMDGNPRVMNPVQPGERFEYDFVVPEAGTYWYHPHVNTMQQLERGLHGSIVVAEAEAPVFTSERMLVLDDIRFDESFQVAPFSAGGHDVVHGRAGNALLTNGSTEPATASVPKGAIERWRLINASNARHMSLAIEGASWRVIATDGGLLPKPYSRGRLEITVGQRFDVEVRFDGELGSTVTLASYVMAQVDGKVEEVPFPLAEYLIEGETETSEPVYPEVTLPSLPSDAASQLISLGGYNDGSGVAFTINGLSGDQIPDLTFAQGAATVITVKNEIGPIHPFHLHGQFFQVLTRQGLPAEEPGLKDSVYVGPEQEVTLLTFFDNPGSWMYHCHVLSHAENGMMAHMIVTPSGAE